MQWLTIRKWFFLLFAGCAGLLAYAMWVQEVDLLEPCPLCILQRVVFMLIGGFALIAAIHNPAALGRLLYTLLISLTALAGIGIAGRHVWLQHLPADKVPDCGPGLEYMLDVFPLAEALGMIFKGSGSCAEVSWQFIGLTMPEWTLIAYLSIFLGSWWMWQRARSTA
ncbi:MAG: disulfide bond formation protein B [Proteobacteria bacterium]|nr:disulfide bond formation protein B [Pseudomonadota bacterium]